MVNSSNFDVSKAIEKEIVFSTSIVQKLNSDIPFISFDEIEAQFDKPLINLGNNISPFELPNSVIKEISLKIGKLSSIYGDPRCLVLREFLSKKIKISIKNILFGSGIDSLLCLIARTFIEKGDLAITTRGTYPTFEYFVKGEGGEIMYADYGSDYRIQLQQLSELTVKNHPKLVYLANPDNPSGTV